MAIEKSKQGIKYKYVEYDKTISSLKDTGVLRNISLEPAKREDYFGFEFSAWIKIPKNAIYKFYTYSDDGAVFYVDDKMIVDNDGSHSAARVDAKVGLKAGKSQFFDDSYNWAANIELEKNR